MHTHLIKLQITIILTVTLEMTLPSPQTTVPKAYLKANLKQNQKKPENYEEKTNSTEASIFVCCRTLITISELLVSKQPEI